MGEYIEGLGGHLVKLDNLFFGTKHGQSRLTELFPPMTLADFLRKVGSSGWIRTSNPPVNRRKTGLLPLVAEDCVESPDRELTSEKSGSIGVQTDRSRAGVCGFDPGLDVSKGQGKDKPKSG